MEHRPTRQEMYFELLPVIAERSTCLRGRTAAIIVRNRRIVSIGYNGAPPGMPHCEPALGCDPESNIGCQNSVHAEANAIAFAARAGITTEGAEMYCMSSPCVECARLIVSCGIITVRFNKTYRAEAGVDWFRKCQVDLVAH